MAADVRWKQRAQNLDKAVALLRDALKNGPDALNDLEKEGTAHRFEYTVEMSWNGLQVRRGALLHRPCGAEFV